MRRPTLKRAKEQGLLRWTYFYLCAIAGMRIAEIDKRENYMLPRGINGCLMCKRYAKSKTESRCEKCELLSVCGKMGEKCYHEWNLAVDFEQHSEAARHAKKMLEAIEKIEIPKRKTSKPSYNMAS